MTCPHLILYKGTHPSFKRCWVCQDCEQLVPELDLTDYAVVLMAVKVISGPKGMNDDTQISETVGKQ